MTEDTLNQPEDQQQTLTDIPPTLPVPPVVGECFHKEGYKFVLEQLALGKLTSWKDPISTQDVPRKYSVSHSTIRRHLGEEHKSRLIYKHLCICYVRQYSLPMLCFHCSLGDQCHICSIL